MPNGYPTSAGRAFAHWDALVSLIQAAAVAGGPLQGIKLVERVAPPEQNVYPCVGVQLARYSEAYEATRRHTLSVDFDVVVAVYQPYDPTQSDTVAAALAALRAYVDDGNGNGLEPLLRANVSLGGACNRSIISEMQYVPLISSSSTAGALASAIFTFRTEDFVRF